MAEWVTCTTCGLRHSARHDGKCPRCGGLAGASPGHLAGSPPAAAVSPVAQELADAQRSLLRMFLAAVATFVAIGFLMVAWTSRQEPPPGAAFVAVNVVLWVALLLLARATYRAANAVGAGSPLLWAVGAFVAPLSLLLVLSLSSRLNEALREQGVEVGFLGPRLP